MRDRYLARDELIAGRPKKEKAEVRKYDIDYTKLLARLGDALSTSTWAEDSGGITIDSESETGSVTTVQLSGGSNRNTYIVENTITTTGSLTLKRALSVTVVELETGTASDDYI
jgi:hypothetical protein